MRPRSPRTAALAALIVALVTMSACTSSGGGAAPMTDKLGLTQAGAQQALLTLAEVGNELQVDPTKASEVISPCTPTQKSVAARFQPRAHAISHFQDSLDSFEFTEVVENFDGIATTKQVANAIEAGLACSNSALGRIAVTINGPQKVDVTTKVDEIGLWTVNSAYANQTIIVARLNTQIVQLIFGGTSQQQEPIDAATIVQQALTKVSATLNG